MLAFVEPATENGLHLKSFRESKVLEGVATYQTPQITEGFQVFQEDSCENCSKTSLVQGLAEGITENLAARKSRPATEGLLLYPISRFSGHGSDRTGNRRPLFDDPRDPRARDLIGLAISFPESNHPQLAINAYLEGSVGWRPVE